MILKNWIWKRVSLNSLIEKNTCRQYEALLFPFPSRGGKQAPSLKGEVWGESAKIKCEGLPADF